MFQAFFHKICSLAIIATFCALPASPARVNPAISLGSTNAIPDTVALFSTTLQAPITSSQTTMTLVSASYNNGASTLASSTYPFIIDEGTSVEEIVTADCTATVCTNLTRGIDRLTGSTTVAALQFAHRRGASVKITDAPTLLILNRIMQGVGRFPNPVRYEQESIVSTSTLALDRTNLASVGLLQDTAFTAAGIVNASLTAKGVVELASQAETASSTSLGGSGASLVIPASNATSTYNSATAALRVVTTQNNGKIDSNFISTTTLGVFAGATFTGTTTMGTTTILGYTPEVLLAASTSAQNGLSYLRVTNIPPRPYYRVVMRIIPSNASGFVNRIRFNDDAGNNYMVSGIGTAQDYIQVSASSITGSSTINMNITNLTGDMKTFTYDEVKGGSKSAFPSIATSTVGVWDSTASLTKIENDFGNAMLGIGSYIYVFGPAF